MSEREESEREESEREESEREREEREREEREEREKFGGMWDRHSGLPLGWDFGMGGWSISPRDAACRGTRMALDERTGGRFLSRNVA